MSLLTLQSLHQPVHSHADDNFALTFAPLSLTEVYALADDGSNGAIVLMSGMVRNATAGRSVKFLEYQAYAPMAMRVFQQIAAQVRVNWPQVNHVVIHHRTGQLMIGEISVLVAIGSPHRTAAFEACQWSIDTLKHNAPIWKKEHWSDGASTWVNIGDCEQTNDANLPVS